MKPGLAMSGLGKFHVRWPWPSLDRVPYMGSCPWMLVARTEEVEGKSVEVVLMESWGPYLCDGILGG